MSELLRHRVAGVCRRVAGRHGSRSFPGGREWPGAVGGVVVVVDAAVFGAAVFGVGTVGVGAVATFGAIDRDDRPR
ncbi:hypothetical protein ACPC54_36975 [Kitasatospora sp. NPDC094028]